MAKHQKECALSTTEDQFPWRGMGLNVDAGTPVTVTYRVFPRGNPFRMIMVMQRCFHALVMWKKPWFLSQGPVLVASCRHKILMTDASLTGWGAILEGRSSQGMLKDQHLSWHINRLEMLAEFLALKNFLANLRGHHVLVHITRGVCGHVHFVNWHAESSCGPKGSCCLFEQLTSRGPTI